MASSIDSCGMYCDMPTACSTVTMDTNAEFGIDAEPMAAKVAVMATTITFPADMCSPFACTKGRTHQHKMQQDYRHSAEPLATGMAMATDTFTDNEDNLVACMQDTLYIVIGEMQDSLAECKSYAASRHLVKNFKSRLQQGIPLLSFSIHLQYGSGGTSKMNLLKTLHTWAMKSTEAAS